MHILSLSREDRKIVFERSLMTQQNINWRCKKQGTIDIDNHGRSIHG